MPPQYVPPPRRKKSGCMIFIIILLLISTVGYIYLKNKTNKTSVETIEYSNEEINTESEQTAEPSVEPVVSSEPTATPIPEATIAPTPVPTAVPKTAAPIQTEPRKPVTYSTYYNSDFHFQCDYPNVFIPYEDSDIYTHWAGKSQDGSCIMRIRTEFFDYYAEPDEFKSNFIELYPGKVEYQNSGDDWFAVRTLANNTYHYAYYKTSYGMLRGFEFHFTADKFDLYDSYINTIYGSMVFRDNY